MADRSRADITKVTRPAVGGPAHTPVEQGSGATRADRRAGGRCGMAETESATTRVWGVPRVRRVPDWVAPPLPQFAWMEHGLLWTYVERGKSPEVHGAQCA